MKETLGDGRYRVGSLIGEGGMGAVYEGVQLELGRPVAIKVMDEDARASPARLARFRREARITGELAHPNIVSVFDVSIDTDGDDPPFLVMERIEGRTLSQVLKEEGAFEPERAMAIGLQLLSALTAAHDAGVVHRDLKPANLMITHGYDGGELLKILDFGVARLLPETGAEKLTRTGQVLGTLNYMAPEQASGDGVDARADVYAAGAVMWAMLAGRPPIPGKNAAEVMARVLRGEREPLVEVLPGHVELARLVDQSMAMDPADRFASAAEMRAALAALAPPALVARRFEAPAPTLEKTSFRRGAPAAGVDPSAGAAEGRRRPRGVLLAAALAVVAGGVAATLVALLWGEGEVPDAVDAEVTPAVVTPVLSRSDAAVSSDVAEDDDDGSPENVAGLETEGVTEVDRASGGSPSTRRGPTCQGAFVAYNNVQTRHNEHERDTWNLFAPERLILARECLSEAQPGIFDLIIRLDASGRISGVSFDDDLVLTAGQRRCFRRVLRGRLGHDLVAPDDIRFNRIHIDCR